MKLVVIGCVGCCGKGKIWIIVSICLFALVGGYYSLSIKPLWGVSGIVSYAENTKIIYGKNKNNQGLVDSYYYKGLNENKKNKTIDSIISNKVLFGNFSLSLNLSIIKRSSYYQVK